MHELPFVMKILAQTDEIAAENSLQSISYIKLRVGELSGIVPECVQLYFETASEGHAANGAELDIETAPAILVCDSCGREFPHDTKAASAENRDPFTCPDCGAPGVLKRGTGSDMVLVSVTGG